MKQLSLLPLMHQFDKEGFMTDTTYFENEECKEGDCYLVFNINSYTMLVPEGKGKWLVDIVEADIVIITKGSYKGKTDCYEIMFQQDEKPLYKMIISSEQFECVSPLKEGWHGRFDTYLGSLYEAKSFFYKVYYRVVDTLPFGNPVVGNKINNI